MPEVAPGPPAHPREGQLRTVLGVWPPQAESNQPIWVSFSCFDSFGVVP